MSASKVGEMIDPKETITAGQQRTLNNLGMLKTAAGVITLTGTALDIANNISQNKKAKEMKEEQEKNIKEKEKRIKRVERKRYWTQKSPIATQGVVMDMFDSATGHTRYGASKLPGL